MTHPDQESPVNPLPPVVAALFVVIVGIEIVLSLGARGIIGGAGAVGWRLEAIQRYAFSDEILTFLFESGRWSSEGLMRFVTYPFVHATFTHAIFAGVMLLALGKMVGDALGSLRTLTIFVVSSVIAALVYSLLLDTRVPLIGAFPPVYGLIGAFTYLLWLRLGQVGARQVRAFSLIGVLLGLQLIFGLAFGGGPDWVADLGGFVAGFGLTVLLVPGGFSRLLARLRGE